MAGGVQDAINDKPQPCLLILVEKAAKKESEDIMRIQAKRLAVAVFAAMAAGQAGAGKAYYYGWDMACADTAWSEPTNAAILLSDRSIDKAFSYSATFDHQSHHDPLQVQYVSLASFSSYSVVGSEGSEKLTLFGDILSVYANSLTVKDLGELQITNGTFGLDASYGNDGTDRRQGGIYVENVKDVTVSGTVSAIYGDTKARVQLSGIDSLILQSNLSRKSEYGEYQDHIIAEADNAIFAGYGSEIGIEAKSTIIKARGRAILASGGNAEYINIGEGSWSNGASPLPVIRIQSGALTIAASTQGKSAAAVYSQAGGSIYLGSAEHKLGKLVFDKEAGARMNLHSDSLLYEDKNSTGEGRFHDAIEEGKTEDDYNLHRSLIEVYAGSAELHAKTNAVNARSKGLIRMQADQADIHSYYGNQATVSSSGGSEVAISGSNIAIANHNEHYLKDGDEKEAGADRVAIAGGGFVNPSRKDLQEDYGGSVDKAGDITLSASRRLRIEGNVMIDADPDNAAGNLIAINDGNDSALVNITGDIYTARGNQVILSLGDGTAAGQAGGSSLTGIILDDASRASGFAFDSADFSIAGTQLRMKDAAWRVTGDSEAFSVAMEGRSVIDLTAAGGYQKVKIAELSGTGLVKLDYDDSRSSTDGSSADKLFVQKHSGTHYLYLNEASGASSLTGGADGTVLASVVHEEGAFKAASDDGLSWRTYSLASKESSTDGYSVDWYLKKEASNPSPGPGPEPVVQPPTRAEAGTLQAFNANYYLWREQVGRLSKRLGISCLDEERSGLWTRTGNSSVSSDGPYGSRIKAQTYALGYDFKSHVENTEEGRQRRFGGMAYVRTHGKGRMNGYDVADGLSVSGGSSRLRGNALLAYYTHVADRGLYMDYVAGWSEYKNDFQLDGVSGHARSRGLQASAEGGYRWEESHGLFFTPNGQLTLGRLSNKGFTTSNGVRADAGHVKSAILSLGADAGRHFADQTQIYVKARYNRELGDTASAAFYQAGSRTFRDGDASQSWWEYGLGLDFKAGKALHVYMDAEGARGGGFKKSWSWRAGARCDF